ncbi:MAG: hypothetical protein ACRDQ4_13305 [Pseudonocardiaceae bacterium]
MHNANRALDLAVTVTSFRCTHAITDLRARLQPFHTVSAARDFDERARLRSGVRARGSSSGVDLVGEGPGDLGGDEGLRARVGIGGRDPGRSLTSEIVK